MAECLVHQVVPFHAILGLVAKSGAIRDEAAGVLASMGVTWVQTAVRPDWYF